MLEQVAIVTLVVMDVQGMTESACLESVGSSKSKLETLHRAVPHTFSQNDTQVQVQQ